MLYLITLYGKCMPLGLSVYKVRRSILCAFFYVFFNGSRQFIYAHTSQCWAKVAKPVYQKMVNEWYLINLKS